MAKFEIKDGVAIIPEGTTEIGGWAFEGCTLLKSITIPESVTEIKGNAFSGCTSLTTVTLPVGVKHISYNAFHECSALSTIYVPADKTDYYKELLPEKLHGKIVELEPEKRTKVRN